MAARVILAPVGAGKTEIALRRLSSILDERQFAQVWVLLPSKRQEDSFRERLATFDPARRIIFNVEFFNFYKLNQRVLDIAGKPQRDLTDTARYGLLRRVIAGLAAAGDLSHFSAIAEMRGFVRVVANFIFELKRERVFPADLIRAAQTQKDRELALIYQHYQQSLQDNDLVDIEGEGWLAVDALAAEHDVAGQLSLLVVDGFDQFTTVQADALSLLADRAEETIITLTTVPDREDTAGRRFTRALQTLESRFAPGSLEIERVPVDADGGQRHPDLSHLIESIFRRDAEKQTLSGGVNLLEAPDPAAETGVILRRIKRLLLDTDSQPDDMMVALRDWERYATHFAVLAEKYSVPVALHYGQPLRTNPAVTALLNLIDLHTQSFRRADVLDTLRSPYVTVPGLTDAHIDGLDRLSLLFTVTGSPAQWQDAILRASRPVWTEYGEEPALLKPDTARYLRDDLNAFFTNLTPPENDTVAGYVRWLERLIGPDPKLEEIEEPDEEAELGGFTLSMLRRIRGGDVPEAIIARDLAALQAFKRVLSGLVSARALLDSLDQTSNPVTWQTFEDELRAAIDSAALDARGSRTGRVLVTTATDARGLPHKHVFIAGLSEGLFPARTGEDPLYLGSERIALRQRGIPLLTRAELASDDGVFYELICLPKATLTLSRPTVDDGKPWIASHLWRASAATFEDGDTAISRDRLGMGQVVGIASASALDEVLLAVVDGLNHPPQNLTDAVTGAHDWLLEAQPGMWSHVRAMRALEKRRGSYQPFDRYTGRIESPGLIEIIAGKLDPDRVWSASQLNDYGTCGFRFFAKRLLKLEPLEEPVEGMDAAQRGSLNHKILQDTYERLRHDRKDIHPDHVDYALEMLELVAQEVFDIAPEEQGFRVTATWEQDKRIILRTLKAVVRADFAGADSPVVKAFGDKPRRTYRLELPFGDRKTPVSLALGDAIGPVRVRGFIDRVDRIGDQALIIDYKSGSSQIKHEDMREGRHFQMLLYIMAAEQLLADDSALPGGIAGGMFWLLPNRKASGVLNIADSESRDIMDSAREQAIVHIQAGRRGDFSVQPSKLEDGKCVRYCEFSHLCRLNNTQRHKPRT